MPSPSRSALFAGVAVTAGIFFGGAWLASSMTPPEDDAPALRVSQSGPLEVTVSGVRDRGGMIILVVYDDQAAYSAYDYRRSVGYAEISAMLGSVSFAFEDLLDGPYAIVAFHDENGNQDLDLADGYPIEGYGISGAKGAYDEPSFEDAAVAAGGVRLSLHYLDE